MVRLQRLERALRLIAASSYVQNGFPLSAVLIAPSDSGKTQLMLSNLPNGARILDDITTASLLDVMCEDAPPKWIVCPDFNKTVSHKSTVTNLTLATLLAFLGEGVTEIPGYDGEPWLKAKAEAAMKRGITLSLITAMTPQVFFANRGKWRQLGLLRRIVPMYFQYRDSTVVKVQDSITAGLDALHYTQTFLPLQKHRVVSIAKPFAEDLAAKSEEVLRMQLKWMSKSRQEVQAQELPFSLHKVFRTLAKSSALLAKRNAVNRADIDNVNDFARFVRYDQPELV